MAIYLTYESISLIRCASNAVYHTTDFANPCNTKAFTSVDNEFPGLNCKTRRARSDDLQEEGDVNGCNNASVKENRPRICAS